MRIFLKILDLSTVIFSFAVTTLLLTHSRPLTSFDTVLSTRITLANVLTFFIWLGTCHLMIQLCGLYHFRRISSRLSELKRILKATTLAALFFVVFAAAILKMSSINPQFVLLIWGMTAVALGIERFLVGVARFRSKIDDRNLRYVLIFGTNNRAVEFAQRITDDRYSPYKLLGFVDDEWPGMIAFQGSGFQVVCDYKGLADFLRCTLVDEVVIYLPFASFYRHWSHASDLCSHHGITVRINADTFGMDRACWQAEEYDGSNYVATRTGVEAGAALVVKRAIDVIASCGLLILLLPLFLLIAIAIKATSPGPVLFSQERVGLNR